MVQKKPIQSIKTKLITRAGYQALQAEHDHLWFKKRPEVTRIVSWAASLGDRSENADYTFNKRLLRQIDSRVRYLRKRLADLQIVDFAPSQQGRVFFGAWVVVEDEQGQQLRFRIVGPDEIYGRNDYISIDAPMARALLKKQVDDSCMVVTPTGLKEWWVVSIEYLPDNLTTVADWSSRVFEEEQPSLEQEDDGQLPLDASSHQEKDGNDL